MRLLLVLAVFSPALALATPPKADPGEIVAAERSFAADAATYGVNKAFRLHVAPDAIVFDPGPKPAQPLYAEPARDNKNTALVWWPVRAGIARSGDLGFTTGPYTVNGDKGFGQYFTVWARQPDGQWKWIFDGGPDNPGPSPSKPGDPVSYLPISSSRPDQTKAALIEQRFAKAAAGNVPAAYAKSLVADSYVMGSPAQPASTPAAIQRELATRAAKINFTLLGSRTSMAGDLVWTYGEAHWTTDAQPMAAHYARIWQKRAAGWALVIDELLTDG